VNMGTHHLQCRSPQRRSQGSCEIAGDQRCMMEELAEQLYAALLRRGPRKPKLAANICSARAVRQGVRVARPRLRPWPSYSAERDPEKPGPAAWLKQCSGGRAAAAHARAGAGGLGTAAVQG
jgi:hypothetical protein